MNKIELSEILGRIQDIQVCVIGDVMLDRYSYGQVDRISPEAPVPVMQITSQQDVLGGAANVYANVCALGARVDLHGVVGVDDAGMVLQTLAEDVCRSSGVVSLTRLKSRPTTTKHRMVAQTQQVLRVDTEYSTPLTELEIDSVWETMVESISRADVVIIADYGKGFLTASLISKILVIAKNNHTPVVVDAKPKSFHLYKGVTLMTPNEKETQQLFPDLLFSEAGKSLAQFCDAHILATRGPLGMEFFPRPATPEAAFIVPSLAKDVRDVSGAGDTVIAVMALALAVNLPFRDAAYMSSLAAAVVIARPHTAVLDKESLVRQLEDHSLEEKKDNLEAAKVITIEQAVALVQQYKLERKKVGCLSGSFDMMSAAHFLALRERSLRCDVLFVLLNSDISIKGYKGINRPLLEQTERAYVLAQSQYVSHIVIFDELTPVTALSHVKPDVYFNVSEWGTDCIEKEVVEKHGGEVMVFDFPIPPNWKPSTSALLKRLEEVNAMPTKKAVFLDRDGVINENGTGYLHSWEDIVIKPGVVEGLRALMRAGFEIFIITNQSGVGRGYFSQSTLDDLHTKLRDYFIEQGVLIRKMYVCPHLPDAGCLCRKPGVALLQKAAEEYTLNLSKSWFVGDSESDMGAARNANVHAVLVTDNPTSIATMKYKPNAAVSDFTAATAIILKNS